MSVNVCLQSGVVKNLALRHGADSKKDELRFTLDQESNGFHLWLPCTSVGATAERLAEQLNEGDAIVITSGQLTYRKRATKSSGEVSRLEILVWAVDRLTESPQVQRSLDRDSEVATPVSSNAPEPKPRRRGYPKAALDHGGFATN